VLTKDKEIGKMSDELYIARFDAFLRDEMSSKEKQAFLNELKKNEELKRAFDSHSSVFEAIRRSGRTSMMAEIGAAHEAMGHVEIKNYRSHNSNAWRSFFKNLFAMGILTAITLFGIKYWDYIKQFDEELEQNSMQFGEPKEKTIRVFIDTIKSEKIFYDTVYREIKVSGSNPDEVQRKLQEELERVKKENVGSDVELKIEKDIQEN